MIAKFGLLPWRKSLHFGTLENGTLKTVFGLKMKEVTGDWRKLCNNEVRNF
jgi:hypothetical protein